MRLYSRPGLVLVLPALAFAGAVTLAQPAALLRGDVEETRRTLAEAREQSESARLRAEKLEAEARRVTEEAEKTAREAAAVAARIQQAEAEIVRQEVELRIIVRERETLRTRLAERQAPLVRLTGALQRLSRRPPLLALLRPGSVRDTMHMRALLETILPEVERRTASLKAEIERGQAIERRALAAAQKLRESEAELKQRRQSLVTIETRQRLASWEARGNASREADRALAFAERARDLGDLVEEVERQGELRAQLERLPGPIMRPPRPEESQVVATEPLSSPTAGLTSYVLPVSGRLVAGFGEAGDGGPRSRGISLATRGGAQAVAPAAGRVAFAGPYRGYDNIVIIEHGSGWASLVTGLVRLDTHVGEELVGGSPLGVAGPRDPVVTVELRHDGDPVNPLQYITSL